MARRLWAVPLVLSLLFAGAAHGDASLIGTPKVSFHAEGSPGALDIEGNTTDLRVADDGTTLTFTVPLDSVTTGIKVRDHHMHAEYAQTSLFPNATLTLDRAGITWPSELGKSTNGTAAGVFTVHGVPVPAQVAYVAKRTKTGTRLTGEFDFDVSRHGIEIPSYLGVTVDPKMHAKATIDLLGVP